MASSLTQIDELNTAGKIIPDTRLACYLPARRAMRVDPVVALRVD